MRPIIVACLIVIAFGARPCAAIECHQFLGGGVNLRWDHCYGDGGVANKSFACDTNSGSEVLVATYVSSVDIPLANGMTTYIDIASSSGTWPAWWLVQGGGACRPNAAAVSPDPDPGATVCQDLWGSGATGGLSLTAGYNGAGTRELRTILAVPPGSEFTVPAGVEVLCCRILINHSKTVGTGACGGCATPVCIALSEIEVSAANQTCSFVISGPAHGTDSHLVTWQSAAIGSPYTHPIPGEYFYWYTTDMICAAITGTRHSAWGEIKALYR